jgi:hypothetical protein
MTITVKEFLDLMIDTTFEVDAPDDQTKNKKTSLRLRLEDFGKASYPGSYYVDTFNFNVVETVDGKTLTSVQHFKDYASIPIEMLNMQMMAVVSMTCKAYTSTSSVGNKYFGNNFGFVFKVTESL